MSRSSQIVHVARDVANTGGGEVVKQLCRGMAGKGIAVALVTDTPSTELDLPGVAIRSTVLGRLLLQWQPRARFGWTVRHLLQIVVFSVASTFAVMPYRLRGAVVFNHNCEGLVGQVLVMHNVFSAELSRRDLGLRRTCYAYLNPVRAVRILKERSLARSGQRILVAVSKAATGDVVHLARESDRVVTIPNAVDLEYFSPAATCGDPSREFSRWKRESGISQVVAFVGHEFKRKGLFDLIAAIELMPSHVGLVVMGGSSEPLDAIRARLRRTGIAERVLFAGEVSDVRPYLRQSQTLCLPSYYESMGLVGLEALALGVPVVVARELPLADYVKPGLNGALCDHDAASIASAVANVLANATRNRADISRTVAAYGWSGPVDAYIGLARKLQLRAGVKGR